MAQATRPSQARGVRLTVIAAMAGLLVALVPPVSAAGLSATACRVTNLRTGGVKTTFPAAVTAAKDGDTLTVRGTCQAGIELGKDLTIRGIRPAGAGRPTLRGVIDETDIAANRSVLRIPDGVSVRLETITLTGGGGTTGFPPDRFGGGLWVYGRATLVSVRVVGNDTGSDFGYGGGIGVYAGDVEILGRSLIAQNSAADGAGIALYARASLVIGDRTTVSGNIATSDGGGILAVNSVITISGVAKIKSNVAGERGGGIYATGIGGTGTALRLRDQASVTANSANASVDAAGGGIFLGAGTWALLRDDVLVAGNSAGAGDGGGIAVLGALDLRGSSVVRENTAAGRGGGVWLEAPNGAIDLTTPATITGNQGFGGGGGLGYDSATNPPTGPCGAAISGNSPNDCQSF